MRRIAFIGVVFGLVSAGGCLRYDADISRPADPDLTQIIVYVETTPSEIDATEQGTFRVSGEMIGTRGVTLKGTRDPGSDVFVSINSQAPQHADEDGETGWGLDMVDASNTELCRRRVLRRPR